MRIGRAALRVGLTALFALLLLGVWGLSRFGPDLLRGLLVFEARRDLGSELRIGALEVSVVALRVAAEDVELREDGTAWLGASRVDFRFAPWRSFWEGALIGDLTIEEPRAVVTERVRAWRHLASALRSADGAPVERPFFLPRLLTIHSGRLRFEWPAHRVEGAVTEFGLEAEVRGLVRRRVDFSGSAKLVVERAGARLDARRVSLLGRASTRSITIELGAIDSPAGSVRTTASVRGGRLEGRVAGDVDWDVLSPLVPEAGIVRGKSRVEARLAGTLEHPEITADLDAAALRIGAVEFSGGGHLLVRGAEWRLERAHARLFGGEVEARANGALSARLPFAAEAAFSRWDPAAFVRVFGPRTPLVGSWSGRARLSGSVLGHDLRGGGRFELERAGQTLDGTATFSVGPGHAQVEGDVGAGTVERIRARYEITAGSAIAGEVTVATERLGAFGRFVGLDLAGAGRARGELRGTVEHPVLAGRGEFSDLRVGTLSIGSVRGPFEISPDGMVSTGLELADGELVLDGRIAWRGGQRNQWSAALRGLSLARLAPVLRSFAPAVPGLGGTADGSLTVAGTWTSPQVEARERLSSFTVGGERIGDGTVEVVAEAGKWRGRSAFAGPGGAAATLELTREPDGGLSGRASLERIHLEEIGWLRERWPGVSGSVRGEGTVGGTVAAPRGDARLSVADLRVGDRPIGRADLRMQAGGEELSLQGTIADHTRVSATARMARPFPFRATAEWRELDVAPLLLGPSRLKIETSGRGALRGDLERPLEEGGVRLALLRIAEGAERLENRDPIDVRIEAGAVDVADAVLAGGRQRVTVGARWTRQEAEFRAVAEGDLAILESLSPDVASARGRLDLEVAGSRRAGDPWRYRGHARLRDGAVDFAFLLGATNVAGSMELEDRTVDLRELTGKLGGGEFLVAGSVGLDRGWDLGWAIHDASLGVPTWLDYRASGNGRFQGPLPRPALTGEIDVAQAVYDRRIEWAEFLPWFRKQARPRVDEARLPFAVDLHLVADGELFVDNNLAKAELRGDLRLREDAAPLRWAGTVEVLNGDFLFRRRRFSITSGSVQFFEDRPLNPDLRFDGETHVETKEEEYQIQMLVSGTAEHPRIQFRADDPSLTENDVLALVTFGRTVSQLQSQGAGIELGEVLALTTGPEASKVQQEIHTILPVDRIEIEPTFSRVGGATEPRLSVAKDLTERFSAVIGTGLGSERNQDVGLEYHFTRRFSLQGVWESQTKSQAGTFGANLKFRVPFRRLPRFSLFRRSATEGGAEP